MGKEGRERVYKGNKWGKGKIDHMAVEKGEPHPQHLHIYMDDCWGIIESNQPRRLGLRSSTSYKDPAESFNQILNDIHPRLKFTREIEENGGIAFLDVFVSRDNDGKLVTRIYRKPTNTNVILKPHSNHHSAVHIANFKGELCRKWGIGLSAPQLSRRNPFRSSQHNSRQLLN